MRLNAKRVWFEPVKDSQTPYGRTIAIRLAAAYGEIGPVSAKIGIEPVDGELYAAAHLDELGLADSSRATMKRLLIITSAIGAIRLFLLASAGANTSLLSHNYSILLGLNIILAVALPAPGRVQLNRLLDV